MTRILITTVLLSISLSHAAQDSPAAVTSETHTVRTSFDEMLRQSNMYQDFKVIKRTRLDEFILEVSDSLKAADVQLQTEVRAKQNYQSQVGKLQTELEESRKAITQAEKGKDSIISAGMSMDKKSFSTLMWSLVIGLGALLTIVLIRSRSASSGQKELRHRLTEVEEYLNSSKKKALEREQELKREIQDYVNRLEALKPPR